MEVQGPPQTGSLRSALLGLAAVNEDLALFDYANVLVRRDFNAMDGSRVLAGGCPGDDLDLAEFVGRGLLTAAVFGDVHESPSSRLILRAIKELSVGQQHGLLVVTAAGPESFNFGLAYERAKSECLRVRLLCVCDDPEPGRARFCGVLLVGKVAGAMAEAGRVFDEIWVFCSRAAAELTTVDLGAGPRETSAKRMKTRNEEEDVGLDKLAAILEQPPETRVKEAVVMLNVPRDVTKLKLLDLVRRMKEKFLEAQVGVCRLYAGSFLHVPEGQVWVTVLRNFDPKLVEYLDAPCGATGWPRVFQSATSPPLAPEIPSNLKNKGKRPVQTRGPRLSDSATGTLQQAVQFACDALISCERQLNIVDSERSKGNVGSRLRRACERVGSRLKSGRFSTGCPHAFLQTLSVMAESSVGGALGSIYGMALEAAADVFGGLPEDHDVTGHTWLEALNAAVLALEECCGGEKTMCSPLRSAVEVAGEAFSRNEPVMRCFDLGVARAEQSAIETRLHGYKYSDSGAHAVGIWMRAVFEGVKLNCADDYD